MSFFISAEPPCDEIFFSFSEFYLKYAVWCIIAAMKLKGLNNHRVNKYRPISPLFLNPYSAGID